MASLPQLLSMLCFALCPLLTNLQALSDDHICRKISSGQLEHIQLKSFTFNGSGELLLFEGDRRYHISLGSNSAKRLMIPRVSYRWDEGLGKAADSMLATKKTLKGVYLMHIGKTRVLNVVTESNEYLYAEGPKKASKVYALTGRVRPDYAIVHDQVGSNVHGYVINRDIYENTDHFVIYQLWLPVQGNVGLFTQTRNASEKTKRKATFYYLEGSQSEITLVHRTQRNVTSRSQSLFRSLPRGYRYEGRLYLFDSDRACVHILQQVEEDLHVQFAKSTANLSYPRIGLPYEAFFDCDEGNHLPADFSQRYPPSRCDDLAEPATDLPKPRTTSTVAIKSNRFLLILGAFVIVISVVMIASIGCRKNESQSEKRSNVKKQKTLARQSIPSEKTVSTVGKGTFESDPFKVKAVERVDKLVESKKTRTETTEDKSTHVQTSLDQVTLHSLEDGTYRRKAIPLVIWSSTGTSNIQGKSSAISKLSNISSQASNRVLSSPPFGPKSTVGSTRKVDDSHAK